MTTNNIRIKLTEEKTVLYDFPVLHVSYCGLDKRYKEAVSFVAKEGNNNNNNNNIKYWSITVVLLLFMEQLCTFVKMLIVSALEELFYFPSSSLSFCF